MTDLDRLREIVEAQRAELVDLRARAVPEHDGQGRVVVSRAFYDQLIEANRAAAAVCLAMTRLQAENSDGRELGETIAELAAVMANHQRMVELDRRTRNGGTVH